MRMIRSLGVLSVVALTVAGCSGSDDTPSSTTSTTSAVPATTVVGETTVAPTTLPPTGEADAAGRFVVTDFGAVADGKNDDSTAFQAAVDAAGERGGVVVVPPVGTRRAYVLNHTVNIPEGVSLVGATAGTNLDVTGPFPWPDTEIPGVKIYARPSPADEPLFTLAAGTTVRGLWITYDQQPLPSDQEFADGDGDYGYDSFADARAFVADHVMPTAPTFYIERGDQVTIEDVIADRYYDFLYMKGGGPLRVDNVALYGYRTGFTIEDSTAGNTFTNISFGPSVGPFVPGPGPDAGEGAGDDGGSDEEWTWAFGAIASNPDNVGFHFGRSDGYVLDNVSFVGGHTAVRLGAAFDHPVIDPANGDFFTSAPGMGPWGHIDDLHVEQAAIAFHMVAPSPNATLMSNLSILLGIDDGSSFASIAGSGNFTGVARQGFVVVEPSYSAENNGLPGQVPAVLAVNVAIGNAADPARFGDAAATVDTANGRVFLIDGDLGMEINGFSMSAPYEESYMVASGESVGEFTVRIRGVLMLGRPEADKLVEAAGVSLLAGDVVVIQPPPTLPPPPPPTTTEPPETTTTTTTTEPPTTTTAATTTTVP